MRKAILLLLLATGCSGALNGDATHFTVRVQDADGQALEGAVVVLDLDETSDDEVCNFTEATGVADVTWDACEFSAFECDEKPYAVRASKEGYRPARQVIGFSSERSVELRLTPCDDGCAAEICDP